jgi:hypothetical protein
MGLICATIGPANHLTRPPGRGSLTPVRTVIVTALATGFGLGSVLRGRLGTGLGISLGVAIVGTPDRARLGPVCVGAHSNS